MTPVQGFFDIMLLMNKNMNQILIYNSEQIKIQRQLHMSAKAVIQTLQDSELIRIFLDFVRTYRLQYQKISKEISYKCYEATWVLAMTKATGYGRTQPQAYKSALKNLLEMLMEDPTYIQFFTLSISLNGTLPKPNEHLKTQGQQPTNKQNRMKYYETSNKIHQMSTKKNPMQQVKLNKQSNSQPPQIYHSKITLNKSASDSINDELAIAKRKMKELENRLSIVQNENQVLKERVMNLEKSEKENQRRQYKQSRSQTQIKHSHDSTHSVHQIKQKCLVPKLKLQILPNYHKNSEKSLNQSLMAAYNEKHGKSKVY